MNTLAFISEDKDTQLVLLALLTVSVFGAGCFLFMARFYPLTLVPATLLLSLAIFLAIYSRHGLFSLLVIALLTSLILSLRFDFLTWGDPWYDYGMIQAVILYQSLNPTIYTAQFPVLHILIATCSFASIIDPMNLQKFIIPSLSVVGVYAVYKITKDISSNETALYAGLLLLCGTPYLHWTTQGVRETIGLTLFILAIYVSFTAIKSQKKGYLFISILVIIGVVLTHHLTMGIFLLVWLAISFTFLYLVCDLKRLRIAIIFSLIITVISVAFLEVWWSVQGVWVLPAFNGLMNTIFFCDYGIQFFLLSIIVIYLIPLVIPEKILLLRLLVQHILEKKDVIYKVYVVVTVIFGIYMLNIILGKSVFSLSYPLSMLFNGICMMGLSLIGLYYFFEKDRLPVLAWVAVLTIALILSLSNIIRIEDRIRFIEFLYIPLSIIAAFGVSRILKSFSSSGIFPILVTGFIVISIVTAFPSIVLLGQPFEPGNPLYDNRSWVIQHHAAEISAISWLDSSSVTGVVETDTYVGYAARGFSQKDSLLIKSVYPFMSDPASSPYIDSHAQNHYLFILSRMKIYLEFGIQWLKEKTPLTDTELQRINDECNVVYDNGDAEIFLFSNQ